MKNGARVREADRGQLRWDLVDLDSQLSQDHRARAVWALVAELDLRAFYDRIKARADGAGRPATDPKILLALWVYATVEGVGSARALARLCEQHTAYRWLCGGVEVNHNILSEFRVENGAVLERLLTQSVTALIDEKLIALEEVAIDGTKVRASASRESLTGAARLKRIEGLVGQHVRSLRAELESDPAATEHRCRARALSAAEERARRAAAAAAKLTVLEAERDERRKTHPQEEARKAETKVSLTDPDARPMRFPDGATRLAYNVQVATADRFIVAIEPTDRRNDSGLAPGVIEQVVARCGFSPKRLLADTTAMTQPDILTLEGRYPGMMVYSPPPPDRADAKPETLRKRAWKRAQEPEPLRQWRERMESPEGQEIYGRRKLTEHAHAQIKNRGLDRLYVRGIEKVRSVCLLHALAHNLMNALRLRAAHA
jgi:transposase